MFDLLKYKERIAVQTDRNESLTYALLHEEAGKFKCAGITQRSSPCIAYIVLI